MICGRPDYPDGRGSLRMNTIFQYFADKLGAEPEEQSLKDLPIDSPCGEGCKAVIDAAAGLLAVSDRGAHDDIRAAAEIAVNIYWVG
jgi:hypothetical protein